MAERFVVGIDLGTTNSAVAYAELAGAADKKDPVQVLEVDQLTAPGEVERRPLLPSAVYLPSIHEWQEGAFKLPFHDSESRQVVGELARAQGAKVPGRLVSSAKSWLCHAAVDRRSAILPPGAPGDVTRLSPVEASARVLEHVAVVWNHHFPDAPLAEQKVVLTVPASFDASARALTLEAARIAGIADGLVLLEEPQAAFYDFHADNDEGGEDLVLVVDVGGGTTDLTLIRAARDEAGQPELERLAVGRHILLGGDNMDMTLAVMAEKRLSEGRRLDPARWSQLLQSCRMAKESLLAGEDAAETYRVVVAGRGSRLIGGSLTTDLTREEVVASVVDGFFPEVALGDRVKRPARTGLAQLGLPYEADPAITRHVAAFLREHGDHEHLQPAKPTAVLLNGGVFLSPVLRERLMQVVAGFDQREVKLLEHRSLSLAVARGAVRFGLAREGIGAKIGGGSAHGYYVEVASGEGDSEDTSELETSVGICVIPRGHEIGEEVVIRDRTFNLVVGRPVEFQVYSTAADRHEEAGIVVPLDGEDFERLPPLQMMIPGEGAEIPVMLHACLTEVGALDLSCHGVDRDERYQLEFDLRGGEHRARLPKGVGGKLKGLGGRQRQAATEKINRIFGKTRKRVDTKEVRQLRQNLELAVGAKRDSWSLPVLRELWELLGRHTKRRRRSPDHEAVFFNLAGYLLRPGFGAPLDEWRVKQLWRIFGQDVQNRNENKVWDAWWSMWRRVVGGLNATQQRELLDAMTPILRPNLVPSKKRPKKPPGGEQEMMRLVASLERLDPQTKASWGKWFLDKVEQGERGPAAWCLARIGARVPFSGAVHNVVDPGVCEEWLDRLLKLKWKKVHNAGFTAAHIARRTDDRLRDVSEEMRERVARQLDKHGDEDLARMVREVVHLEASEEAKFAGDSLPPGLILVD